MALTSVVAKGLFDVGSEVIDRLFPDPEQKAKAKKELEKLEQNGELERLSSRMSAIETEANSEDSWTSRARPTFLYVFYLLIFALVIVAPFVGIFYPEQMTLFFENVQKGFDAIPKELWVTFGSGFLGYTGFRTYEKKKGLNKGAKS